MENKAFKILGFLVLLFIWPVIVMNIGDAPLAWAFTNPLMFLVFIAVGIAWLVCLILYIKKM